MLFNSFHFFAFFAIVLLLNHSLRRREGLRRWMLLIASAYFYGQWNWFYLILIYTTVIVDFTVGRHIYGRMQMGLSLIIIGLVKKSAMHAHLDSVFPKTGKPPSNSA